MEHLLLTAEIFLNAPSGKIKLCYFEDSFFGTDLLIRSQHHRMFRDPVDQDEIDVLSGSCDLYLHMGQVCIMALAPVIKGQPYLALALVPELCRRHPFLMEEELPPFREADDIILSHAVQLKEHLVIVISSVHDKGGFPQKGCAAFHCGKCHVIDGSKIFLF